MKGARDLSIYGFCYPQEVLEPTLTDTKGKLYVTGVFLRSGFVTVV